MISGILAAVGSRLPVLVSTGCFILLHPMVALASESGGAHRFLQSVVELRPSNSDAQHSSSPEIGYVISQEGHIAVFETQETKSSGGYAPSTKSNTPGTFIPYEAEVDLRHGTLNGPKTYRVHWLFDSAQEDLEAHELRLPIKLDWKVLKLTSVPKNLRVLKFSDHGLGRLARHMRRLQPRHERCLYGVKLNDAVNAPTSLIELPDAPDNITPTKLPPSVTYLPIELRRQPDLDRARPCFVVDYVNSGQVLVTQGGKPVGIGRLELHLHEGEVGPANVYGRLVTRSEIEAVLAPILNNQGYPWHGVHFDDLPSPLHYLFKNNGGSQTPPGLYPMITWLESGSPAQQAGLQAGDILKDLNGAPIPSWEALTQAVNSWRVGQVVTFGVHRKIDSRWQALEPIVLEVTARPLGAESWYDPASDLFFKDLTPQDARYMPQLGTQVMCLSDSKSKLIECGYSRVEYQPDTLVHRDILVAYKTQDSAPWTPITDTRALKAYLAASGGDLSQWIVKVLRNGKRLRLDLSNVEQKAH